MLPDVVDEEVNRYLAQVDEALPGRLEGFYLVGSTALGAFRPLRSDIDFVAVVGSRLDARELGRLKAVQARLYRQALARTLVRMPWRWPLVCNGVFVQWKDLVTKPASVVPVAAHSAGRFEINRGFDVNPVTWWLLATHGIAVRGPEARRLGVQRDERELRNWTLVNLDTYWRRWVRDVTGSGFPAATALFAHYVAWGVLGAARMQFTIRTGEVASKERAGEYALEVCASKWHRLIRETLAYWSGEKRSIAYRTPTARRTDAAAFVLSIVEASASGG